MFNFPSDLDEASKKAILRNYNQNILVNMLNVSQVNFICTNCLNLTLDLLDNIRERREKELKTVRPLADFDILTLYQALHLKREFSLYEYFGDEFYDLLIDFYISNEQYEEAGFLKKMIEDWNKNNTK